MMTSRMRYTAWRRCAPGFYFAVLLGLMLVLIPGIGVEIGGARRWFDVGGFGLQPAEFAKLAAVLTLSVAVSRLSPGSGIPVRPLVAVGLLYALVLVEPDFGTSVMILSGVAGVLWASELRTRDLLLTGGAALAALAGIMFLEPYRRERFLAFLDPWAAPEGSGYQVVQSMLAIKSGRIFGAGAGAGDRAAFVPEAHTDMIFALIGEELGLVGMLLVIAAFGFLSLAGSGVAFAAPTVLSRCMAAGITTMFSVQATFNMGASMGVIPLSEMTLPFVSYGGSSLLVSFAAVGILCRISEDGERERPSLFGTRACGSSSAEGGPLTIDNPEGTVGPGKDRWRSPRNERERGGKKRGGRGGHGNGGPGFAAPVVVICAVVAVLVALHAWANAGQIYGVVQVRTTVALGGMTPEEAREALEECALGPLKEIELNGPEDFAFTAEELGVDFNVDATVEDAYSVGREGNILERLADRVRGLRHSEAPARRGLPLGGRRGKGRGSRRENERRAPGRLRGRGGVRGAGRPGTGGLRAGRPGHGRVVGRALEDLSGEAALVGETLEPGIPIGAAERAAEKARKAMAGPVVLTAEGRRWTLSPADVGQTLDFTRRGGEIRVGLNEERLRASLAGMYAALTVEPVEAGFVVNGAEVSDDGEPDGQEHRGRRALRGDHVRPVRWAAQLRGAGRDDYAGAHDHRGQEAQAHDTSGRVQDGLHLGHRPRPQGEHEASLGRINGTLVAPGEVFSYNAVTEPLDYEPAKVIKNGGVDYEEGGGLSQVSSTLYNMTANLAGLEIVEANPHYAELPYIRPGFDTTVWFGALDLRFENNTGGYVLIQEWLDPAVSTTLASMVGPPAGR